MHDGIAPIVVLLIAACEAKPAATTPNAAPARATVGETWTIDSLEQLRITGITNVDSLVPLTDIKGLARLEDGSVVVADGRTSALEFFNAEGEYTRTVGDKGSKHDEFSRLTTLMHCGDSLYVLDPPQRHYKVLSAEGVGVRTFAPPTDSAGEIPTQSACNADGVFVNYVPGYSVHDNQALPALAAARLWISSPKGTLQATLGKWQSDIARSSTTPMSQNDSLSMVDAAHVAIGRNRAYLGTSDDFIINVYTLRGDSAGTIAKQIRARPNTPADIERYKMRDTAGRSASDVAIRNSKWKTVRFPQTLPAYTGLIVDSEDNLWVRAQPPITDEWVEWYVFGPTGKEIAHSAMPQSFQVYEIGTEWVLGIDVDPLTHRQTVKAFTLRRQP